jgi:predicted Holliday junction resolvase-like endonuclease
MISLSSILNRLDLVFYIVVFAIIYVAIIYLWKKIAQLESSFYKLETTFATQLLYKNKENPANQFAEDMFMKVFNNTETNTNIEPIIESEIKDSAISIEAIKSKDPMDITDITDTKDNKDSNDPIITEVNEMLTPSVDDNVYTKSKLAKMSVEQLKEHCGNFGISTEGTKPELINKLLSHQK